MRLVLLFVVMVSSRSISAAVEIGETVVAIQEATIQRDGVNVDQAWLGQDLKIEPIEGERLWVNSDHPGWISRQHVESLDRAGEYFTDLIEKKPNDARYYNARGNTEFQLQRRDRKPIHFGAQQEGYAKDFDTAIKLSPMALYHRNRALSNYDRRIAIRDLDEAIRLSPTSAAYADRGLFKKLLDANAEVDEDFEEAIRLDPLSIRPYVNRGKVSSRGVPTADDCSAVIKRDPYNDDAYVGRGQFWIREGKRLRALMDFRKAIEINPRNARAHEERAFNNLHLGNLSQAIEDFDAAEAFGALTYINNGYRARAYLRLGEYDKAIQDLDACIIRMPTAYDLYYRRAEGRRLKGEYALAIADLEQATKLAEPTRVFSPDYVFLYYHSLAWLYATCPDEQFRDGHKSLELAKKACEVNGGPGPYELDTLAAAFAEVGEFDEAIKHQIQALKVAPENKREAYAERLEFYRNNKPFREVIKKNP